MRLKSATSRPSRGPAGVPSELTLPTLCLPRPQLGRDAVAPRGAPGIGGGEADPEDGAPRLALDGHLAGVRADHSRHDGQAEAGAALRPVARLVAAGEAAE